MYNNATMVSSALLSADGTNVFAYFSAQANNITRANWR